jgi:Tol biopolymer transport system component
LIYIQGTRQLISLDLVSGQQTTLFDAPDNAWVSAASISKDGEQIVLAYALPPKDPSQQQFGYTDLYTLPADGSSAPQILLQRANDKEAFFNPVWSADGKYVYYSHLIPDPNNTQKYTNFKYDLERISLRLGRPQKILDNAFWPRLSPDGMKLAYVSFDPKNNANDLYLADIDGGNSKLVMPAGTFYAVDAPVFSPDSQTILFSAVGEPQKTQLSWFDQLMGVQIAEAHSVPSDWWRVSISGGKPERVTNIADTGLYGDYSPDSQHVAFVSATGLFVMNPDGSNLVQLFNYGPSGTVNWMP